jgi:hypothetical protein
LRGRRCDHSAGRCAPQPVPSRSSSLVQVPVPQQSCCLTSSCIASFFAINVNSFLDNMQYGIGKKFGSIRLRFRINDRWVFS